MRAVRGVDVCHRAGVQSQGNVQSLPFPAVDVVDVGARLHLDGRGGGIHQPGVAAAQADQVMMDPAHGLAQRGQRRWRVGKGGAHFVVAPFPVGLDALEGLFVAVVDGRDAPHGEENGGGQGGLVVADAAGNAGDIVVADEGHRHEAGQEVIVARQTPVQLEEVALQRRAPGGLPQLVLGDGIHAGASHDVRIVAVYDLADDPGVGEFGAHAWQHLGPEFGLDGIGGVQTPGRGAAPQPVAHDIDHPIDDGRGIVVERGQRLVAFEVVVMDAGFGAVDAEQGLGSGIVARQRGLKARMPDTHMVEHAIEHQVDAAFLAGAGQMVEGGVVTQPAVDAVEIQRVVAVAFGLEDGPQGQAVGAQADQVVEPRQQAVQPGGQRPFLGRGAYGGPGKAQGIDMPPDGVVDPAGHGASLPEGGPWGPRLVHLIRGWQGFPECRLVFALPCQRILSFLPTAARPAAAAG